ncbi:MAG: S8 family serine peptidase [Litorilinea sp.]
MTPSDSPTRVAQWWQSGARFGLRFGLRFGIVCLCWWVVGGGGALHSQATAQSAATPVPTDPRISVVVELADAPVIQVYLAAQAAEQTGSPDAQTVDIAAVTAQAHLAAVDAQQTAVLDALNVAGADVAVLYRNQRVYNGMGLMLDAAHLDQLAALPNVVAVYPLIPKSPATADSVPHIHAPYLWNDPTATNDTATNDTGTGYTGAGVRIAVIDTGVDYLHTLFGGPGSGYAQNDHRLIGDVPNFPGPKIVGGWDFAGDVYNADPEAPSYAPMPLPNPDPMDCYAPGHGTHVAGIVGGYGVTNNGATYPGPYAPDLAENFRIGPGVAPHAQLYALKVFGCRGKTALVDAAIEWSVDPNRDGDFSDRVDIINLSLGSGYGSSYDSTAVAADNAARLGIVVVSSAGNNGDTVYAVGSPGIAEAGISTAATRQITPNCATAPCPTIDLMAEFSARGPRREDALLKPDLSAPGYAIFSARAGSGNGGLALSGTSMAAPHVAGAAALLLQEMRAANLPPAPEQPDAEDRNAFLGQPTLWQPTDVKARLMNTAHQAIQPAPDQQKPAYTPVRMGAGAIDLQRARAATSIAYSADTPAAVSISFGAPTVVDSYRQTRNVQVANRGPQPITFTVSYSTVLAAPGVSMTLPTADATGVLTVTLDAYDTATLPLELEADVQTLTYRRDPTLAGVVQFPRHWLGETAGYVVFSPVADERHPTLVVPVYAAPQPAATLQTLPPALDFGNALRATRTLQFVGTALTGDAPPQTPVSLASVVELHHVSKQITTLGGLPAPTFAHADLRYVGAAIIDGRGEIGARGNAFSPQTDSPDGQTILDERLLYFGIATHGTWSTLNEVEFNIFLDVDGDRRADYRLYNSDLEGYAAGLWTEVRGGDVLVTALENLATGDRYLADFVNGASAASYTGNVYNTHVVALPLPLHLLEWDAEQTVLNYRFTTYSRTFGNHPLRSPVVDNTPWLQLQITPPALNLDFARTSGAPASPLMPANPATRLTVGYRVHDYLNTRPTALMILHHHNHPDRRVEIIPIAWQLPFQQFFPFVQSNADNNADSNTEESPEANIEDPAGDGS